MLLICSSVVPWSEFPKLARGPSSCFLSPSTQTMPPHGLETLVVEQKNLALPSGSQGSFMVEKFTVISVGTHQRWGPKGFMGSWILLDIWSWKCRLWLWSCVCTASQVMWGKCWKTFVHAGSLPYIICDEFYLCRIYLKTGVEWYSWRQEACYHTGLVEGSWESFWPQWNTHTHTRVLCTYPVFLILCQRVTHCVTGR